MSLHTALKRLEDSPSNIHRDRAKICPARRDLGIFCLMYCLVTWLNVIAAHTANPIPYGWEDMCTSAADPDVLGLYVDNITTVSHMLSMQCHVTEEMGAKWKFQMFRNWLHNVPDTSVFLQVTCSDRGRLSLPWPMKARGLVGLKISNCYLTDKYSDFNNPDISKIPNQLRVSDIRDSIWLSDGSGFDKITSPEGLFRLTSDYDCGQDSTIEYMVNSNVSDKLLTEVGIAGKAGNSESPHTGQEVGGKLDFELQKLFENSGSSSSNSDSSSDSALANLYDQIGNVDKGKNSVTENPKTDAPSHSPKPEEVNLLNTNVSMDGNASDAASEYLKLLDNLKSLDLKCNYEKLKLLDESFPPFLPYHHFELMVRGAVYPELRIMNYSFSGMRQIPRELQDFRRYFPKLEYLDLSNNRLTEIRMSNFIRPVGGGFLTLDARHNQITNFSVEDLTKWSKIEGVFIDIRENPIHCDCHMEQLFNAIKSVEFFQKELAQYDYIREMECASPRLLKGHKLSKLEIRCTTSNYAAAELPSNKTDTQMSSSMVAIIVGSSLLALIVLGVLVVVMVKVKVKRGGFSSNKLKEKAGAGVETPKSSPEKNLETVLNHVDEPSGKI